jgi:cytochrome P450
VASPDQYPVGAGVTVEQLDADPHPVLARLREREPVSWIPVLDGWLVTRHDLALEAMRDARTFTVDDPRFSTARVIGPSMLSLDGDEHARHRTPFVAPFRPVAVRERFAEAAAQEAGRLIEGLRQGGTTAELRRGFAGPLAAAIVTRALGLEAGEVPAVLRWYEAIVSTVTEITAGAEVDADGRQAFSALSERLSGVIEEPGSDSLLAAAAHSTELSREQIVSNAAVLLFGGIETTEGMIAGALLHLLQRTDRLQLVRSQPELLDAAIEESLRLEPAAAVIDRYATRATTLGNARIARGELVRLSLAAANRDPAVFGDPDKFDLQRPNARRHLAFAQGPHVCVGVHLARLETRTGLAVLIKALPGLRLDPERPSEFRGLVFRKPPALQVNWD